MQTGQGVSAKMLLSSGTFQRQNHAELLGEPSTTPGCRQQILPGCPLSLALGSAVGRAAEPLLKPKPPCADGSQQNSSKTHWKQRSQILRRTEQRDLLSPSINPGLYPDTDWRAKLLCKPEPCAQRAAAHPSPSRAH